MSDVCLRCYDSKSFFCFVCRYIISYLECEFMASEFLYTLTRHLDINRPQSIIFVVWYALQVLRIKGVVDQQQKCQLKRLRIKIVSNFAPCIVFFKCSSQLVFQPHLCAICKEKKLNSVYV